MDSGAEGGDLRSMSEVLQVLWAGKAMIALITSAIGTAGVVYALTATEIYRAEALVQPRQDARGGIGFGALAAQFSGLADMAGLSLGMPGDRSVALATLRSRALIEQFITDKALLPKLYESKWNSETKQWKNPDPKKTPTVWQGYNDFTKRVLKISEDKKTGLVIVAIEWTDPQEARDWVTEVIGRTNEFLRSRAIEEGERNLRYLDAQSRLIGQVELRQSLYGLVESELKKLMVAKGGDEFALKTIDPAVVPMKRIWPKRTAIVLMGLVFGTLLGAAVVWFREEARARARSGIATARSRS